MGVFNGNGSANDMLGDVIQSFRKLKLKNKIYVIMDEYDHFTNGMLNDVGSKFKTVVNDGGFVRVFFEVIKKRAGETDASIAKFFGTGVAPLTLDSMTSGFNIATAITTSPKYVAMTGFTKDEVKRLTEMVTDDKMALYDIYSNFDGYRFTDEDYEKIEYMVNPTLVLKYLNDYQKKNGRPKKLVDKNILTIQQKLVI